MNIIVKEIPIFAQKLQKMKKVFLIIVLVLCWIGSQGQTTSDNTTLTEDLNAQSIKFTELSQKKDYKRAIEEGVRLSVLYTQSSKYNEAFATCRQMDALVLNNESETKQTNYALRFPITKERLRIYTRLKKTEQCKAQLDQLKTYAKSMNSEETEEDVLFMEAKYYQTFGMPDKSLECYKTMFQKRVTGKDEQGTDQCFKDMLAYAQQNNNAPLAQAMQKLYTDWQDSIQAVKAARELSTLQEKYEVSQKTLQEKEDKISTNLYTIIALCILSAALAAGLLFITLLLLKHIRQVRKLKHSLQIANENNEQKSKFISSISTQIEPSLTAMDEATSGVSANILHENINALKKFISDIQTYVALEETREEHYLLKELNINTLCESIMEKAKVNFKPEVEAVIDVPRINIKTNAEELEHILLHLLNNAAEHTESGKITLSFKKRSAHTHQFIITDTGSGIPVEERGNLFKPFAETHDLTEGDRLGLPTCSLVAYKLNGSLSLDTEYKKGSRFILELHV